MNKPLQPAEIVQAMPLTRRRWRPHWPRIGAVAATLFLWVAIAALAVIIKTALGGHHF